MLPRSTPTSASGSCQVWRPSGAVRLSLPILDSCGLLLFYFGPFHILHFLLPSPKHNSLSICFLVQRRHQQVGRVKCDVLGKQYVFPRQLLIVVFLCCFILVHFTSYPSVSFFLTQQPFTVLLCSTPISATGSCQVWRPWAIVSLSLPIVDSCGPCCFIWSISHLTFLLPLPKHNSLLWCFLVQRRHQQLGRVKCDKHGRQ